jgi:hypothetical protein
MKAGASSAPSRARRASAPLSTDKPQQTKDKKNVRDGTSHLPQQQNGCK